MANSLESDVLTAAKGLIVKGIRLYKIPEEFKQTPCDFFGFTKVGRIIMLECKMSGRVSLPIGGKTGVKAHQWGALLECQRAGGLAYVVWQRREEVLVFPVGYIEEYMKRNERASVIWHPLDELESNGVGDAGGPASPLTIAHAMEWWCECLE